MFKEISWNPWRYIKRLFKKFLQISSRFFYRDISTKILLQILSVVSPENVPVIPSEIRLGMSSCSLEISSGVALGIAQFPQECVKKFFFQKILQRLCTGLYKKIPDPLPGETIWRESCRNNFKILEELNSWVFEWIFKMIAERTGETSAGILRKISWKIPR